MKFSPYNILSIAWFLSHKICLFLCDNNNNLCLAKSYEKDFPRCLQFVKQKLEDENSFWFSNDFKKIGCNYENYQTFQTFITNREAACVNERPINQEGYFLSLGSRLFFDNDYKNDLYLKEVEGIFEVQFVSPPDIYHGCNTTGELLSTITIDVYPGMPTVPAILTRHPPFLNPPGCNLTNLCTIIFYDAGHSVLHNVWTNWPKENNINDYVNPAPGGLKPNPYVFLAFRQKSELSFRRTDEGTPWSFNIRNFTSQFDLQGPIAINFLSVLTDISAQEDLFRYGLANNCPGILEEILKSERDTVRHDLGLDGVTLNSWLSVKFQVDEFNYTTCCGRITKNGKTIWVDSLRNGVVEPELVRNKPNIYLNSRLFYFPSYKDFKGQLFTLLMIRPENVVDAQTSELKNANAFVHWAIINLADGSFSAGSEIRPYLEPLPATEGTSNRYYILLLKQNKKILSSSFERYFDESKCTVCPISNSTCNHQVFDRRCGLPLNNFMRENELNLWGLARFRLLENGANYLYIQCVLKKYGIQTEFDCADVNCANLTLG